MIYARRTGFQVERLAGILTSCAIFSRDGKKLNGKSKAYNGFTHWRQPDDKTKETMICNFCEDACCHVDNFFERVSKLQQDH